DVHHTASILHDGPVLEARVVVGGGEVGEERAPDFQAGRGLLRAGGRHQAQARRKQQAGREEERFHAASSAVPVAGSVSVNVVWSFSTDTSSVPPCPCVTISWARLRPRPVPSPAGLVVKNGSKMRARTFSG